MASFVWTIAILQALEGNRRFVDIMDVTGLTSGTVHSALERLEELGHARSKWEDEAIARREARPARRYVEITRRGAARSSQGSRAIRC